MTMELENIYRLLPTEKDAIDFLEDLIWGGNPVCPYCKSHDVTSAKRGKRHHCNTCNTSFSVTVNTIFHRTKVDFQKWIFLLWLISTGKKMPSLRNLSEELFMTKDTVSKMLIRIRGQNAKDAQLIDKILNIINNGNTNA